MKKWLFVVLIAGLVGFSFVTYYEYSRRPGFTGKNRSIAVLPFTDTKGDKRNEYFSDGFTEDLISELNKITDLKVTPRGSAMGYKSSKKSLRDIARDLHVAALLQGEIEKHGNWVKINARLVDPNTGSTVWAESYDRDLKDLFAIEAGLAQLVAGQMHAAFTDNEKSEMYKRPTQNLEAYDQYQNGRYFYYKRTYESLRKAIEYFNLAIRLDPAFSKAYSGLADCYSAQGYISYESPATAFLRAEKAAVKALELDSTLAEPHTSLGYIKFYYYWDWSGAEKEFREAIRLDPGYALAYDSYGYYLTAMERYPEANVVMEKALQLDPLSAQLNTDLGFSLYYARKYNQATQSLRSAFLINPKAPLAHLWLGRVYEEKKMYKEANEQYQLTLAGFTDWPVAYAAMGHVYGVSGQEAEAKKTLDTLQGLSASRYVTPYGLALVYEALNDKKKTFEWLDKAYSEHSNWLVWLKLDPRWALISTDARYKNLISKIGLPTNGLSFPHKAE